MLTTLKFAGFSLLLILAFGAGLLLEEGQKQLILENVGLEKDFDIQRLKILIERKKEELSGKIGSKITEERDRIGQNLTSQGIDDIDTSSWKTYRNEKYGFEVKYPPNYTTKESELGDISFYREPDYQKFLSGSAYKEGGPPVIEFEFYKNPNKLSALGWAKTDIAHSNFTGAYETRTIAGEEAIGYSWSGIGGGDVLVFTSKDRSYIVVLGTISLKNGEDLRDDFTKMVSTFKFTP